MVQIHELERVVMEAGITPGIDIASVQMTEEEAQSVLHKLYTNTRQRTEWISVWHINVDESYQRNMSSKRVDGLVATFIPALLGTLVVSRRDDGSFWVMDGQHRLMAARRAGLKHVLCEVWGGLTRQLEAAVFIILNSNRTAVTGIPAFKARLEANEPVAMDIKRIVERNHAVLRFYSGKATRAGEVRAFSTLEAIYRANGPAMLDAVMAMAMNAWPGDQGNLQVNVLTGLHQFMASMDGEFDPVRLLSVLRLVEPMKIIRAGASARQAQGGELVYHTAMEITRLYNVKLRGGTRLDPARLRLRNRLANQPTSRAATRSAVVEMADLLRREAQRINNAKR